MIFHKGFVLLAVYLLSQIGKGRRERLRFAGKRRTKALNCLPAILTLSAPTNFSLFFKRTKSFSPSSLLWIRQRRTTPVSAAWVAIELNPCIRLRSRGTLALTVWQSALDRKRAKFRFLSVPSVLLFRMPKAAYIPESPIFDIRIISNPQKKSIVSDKIKRRLHIAEIAFIFLSARLIQLGIAYSFSLSDRFSPKDAL